MRIIQVGVGKMGRTWAREIPKSPDVELVGIVEPVAANREWAQENLSFAASQAHTTVDDALSRDDWDAAVVVTPPATHRPVAEQLLRSGRHVLLEKPLADTPEDARALVDIAADTGQVLMVAQNYRYRPDIRAVQAAIASGEIGTVRSIAVRFHRDTRTLFGSGDFRYQMRQPLVIDMSIHHFDMLRAMTGLDVTQLYARTWHVPGGVYEDHPAAAIVMTLSNGATATYDGNWAGFDTDTTWDGEWDIVGDSGRIRWRTVDERNDVALLGLDGTERPLSAAPEQPTGQLGLLAEFAAAVRSGTQPPTSAGDNIRSLGIGFAVVESSTTGRAIDLAGIVGA